MKTVTLRNYKQNDSENSLRDIYAMIKSTWYDNSCNMATQYNIMLRKIVYDYPPEKI